MIIFEIDSTKYVPQYYIFYNLDNQLIVIVVVVLIKTIMGETIDDATLAALTTRLDRTFLFSLEEEFKHLVNEASR